MQSDVSDPTSGSENEVVHFDDVHIEPWPDGRRVRIHITLSPFSRHPNLEAALLSNSGEEISRLHIIETPENKIVFTMHLRGIELPATLTLQTRVFFEEEVTLDEKQIQFIVKETQET